MRRGRRAGRLLALSLVVALLGVVAVSAFAQSAPPSSAPCTEMPCVPAPSTPVFPSRPDPCAGPEPRPVLCTPLPTRPTPPVSPTSTPSGSTAPSTAPAPCTGEDCIPQPTTPPPGSGGPQQPGAGNGDSSDCGITDIGACIAEAINSMFRSLVEAALSPILDLLGSTVLSTPTISDLPGIGELWNNSWGLVVAGYGLLILIGGILLMGHESVQTRYSIKEIGPRIPIAFLASALSLFFVDKIIRLANALTIGVLGDGVNAPSLGHTLQDAVAGMATGGLFIILTGLILVIVGMGLLIVYAFRLVVTVILIVSGPLFLMGHALPHTDPLARWWWKATGATVAIQLAQALTLITAVRTFLSGGVHLFGSTGSAFATMIAAIALFFILFKIPFWLLRAVKVSSGRSLLGGLLRAYVIARTFGMVTGHTRARTTGRGAQHGSGSGGAGQGQPATAGVPTTLGQRLQQGAAAQRLRAARRSRLPSQAPRFLQPQPQQPIHNPAMMPATPFQPAAPGFSSASSTPPPTSPSSTSAPPPRPTVPQFQSAAPVPPVPPPIPVPSVPPHLRFHPATAPPEHLSRPVRPSTTQPPSAPAFRPADPPPRYGDARPRTPSVPPTVFRAPTFRPPPAGGETR
ncbi:hypothetical protein [Actinocrispum wychmicini]|uniref:hypothetical protein n=1 Tax=Actinocrispum wychmicini TaxID=1213861 RepID=UPI001FB6C658|nr:hypothetical protein [Actinocrispum wychmicini]